MEKTVYFSTYTNSSVPLTTSYLSRVVYSEAVLPTQYDYRDSFNGLSYQLISPTKVLVADPAFPVVSQILAAQWQVIYDSTYSSVGNLKFVAKGLDATVSANWKSINDLLQQYNYTGVVPIVSLAQVYMMVVSIQNNQYIVGTVFTPSQPFVEVCLTGAPPTLTVGTERLIPFNAVLGTIDVPDSAQIVPVISGADTGKLQLSVPGVYLVEVSCGVQTSGVATITNPVYVQLGVWLNGSVKVGEGFGAIGQYGTVGDGSVQLTTIVRVTKSQLSINNKATLEARVFTPGSSGTYQIDNGSSTALAIYFLG